MGVLENEEGSRQCWWTLRNAAGAVTDIVPAVVVHQAHGRVTLTVTCDAGDGTTSELTVQITPEQWRALPASSATDLRMVNESAASCDALQLTMPNSPSLMHLIRRRYHLGLRTTRLGPWLIAIGGDDAAVEDGAAEATAAALQSAALHAAVPEDGAASAVALGARALHRMLSLQRKQAILFVGGSAGGAPAAVAARRRRGGAAART